MIRKFFWVLLIITIAGYGLLASRHTSAGEWLYPVKVLGDQIEYQLTPGDSNKARLKLGWLAQQGVEVKKDAQTTDQAKTDTDKRKFQDLSGQIQTDIQRIEDSGRDVSDLKATLQAIIENCKL